MKKYLKSQLGRSQLIRQVYSTSLSKYAQHYRSVNSHDKSDEYKKLQSTTSVDYGLFDGNLFKKGVELKPHPEADNPILTKDDIVDAKASFVADPFIVYRDGIYDMFFEIKDKAGEVYIGHAFSKDGVNYKYNKIIIEPEVAHHTYPYVFKFENNWLMVPSPGPNVKGEFRIYVAEEYPTEWRLLCTPITKRVRQDPTPIQWNDNWYLIYQDTDSLDIILKYSDRLIDGGWNEHPKSPIFENDEELLEECSIGSAEMVPSGRPIYHNDSIDVFYRSHLNKEVYQYRITTLSESSFEQVRMSDIDIFDRHKEQRWNKRFMHTINPIYPWIGTDNVVAVDGLEDENYTYSIGLYKVDS